MTAEFQNLKEVRTESCLFRVFSMQTVFLLVLCLKFLRSKLNYSVTVFWGFFSLVFFIVLTNFWGK